MRAILLTLAFMLGACTTISQRDVQVTTLTQAQQAATLVTKGVTTYVKVANPDLEQRKQIGKLSDAVHAALVELENARRAGKDLSFDSFNAALAALKAYKGNQP